MKITIEVDIPNGRSVSEAEAAVKRHFDPDWMAIWWNIDDVKEQYEGDGVYSEVTDAEAREVLRLAEREHDSEVGINWEVLDFWIDHVKEQRKEVENA
jgi:hypothetical protein